MRLIDSEKTKEVLKKLLLETALNNTGDFSTMCVNIAMERIDTWIGLVPTVDAKPTEEQFEWCRDCKEYDQNAHCCHRWTKVIRNTVNDLKTQGYEPVRHGKWIIRDNPGTGWYRVTCSECGEDVTATAPCIGFFPNAKVIWDYCPYCGVKMDEEKENEM